MYTTSTVEATRANGLSVVPMGSCLNLPSNLSVRRLKAPLELTTEDGNQIVIVDPPDVINFSFKDAIEIAIKLAGVILGGGDDTGGGSGSGGGDKVTVTVEGGKGKDITIHIK